jgi:hypothetical protein
MFVVSEEAAASIRTAYEQEGELSAAIELRRLFPGIADNAEARECARTHRQLETADRSGLSDYPVTPSQEPGSAGEAVIELEPVGRDAVR